MTVCGTVCSLFKSGYPPMRKTIIKILIIVQFCTDSDLGILQDKPNKAEMPYLYTSICESNFTFLDAEFFKDIILFLYSLILFIKYGVLNMSDKEEGEIEETDDNDEDKNKDKGKGKANEEVQEEIERERLERLKSRGLYGFGGNSEDDDDKDKDKRDQLESDERLAIILSREIEDMEPELNFDSRSSYSYLSSFNSEDDNERANKKLDVLELEKRLRAEKKEQEIRDRLDNPRKRNLDENDNFNSDSSKRKRN